MKRSLIAGATAVGLLLTALVSPAVAAAEVQPLLATECDGTAQGEAEATALAAACGEDVEVLGATGEGATLIADPDGAMRLEVSAVDPNVAPQSTARTVLRPSGPSDYDWTGTQWVGYCDPAEYARGCSVAGIQRLVWQFDGMDLLAGLEPEDIKSAEFSPDGQYAWLDRVHCTPSRLDLYDIPQISADAAWESTAAWTADKRVGSSAFYAEACEQTPRWGFDFDFDLDATEAAVRAAREDRSSVTLGLSAADETCMTCGWNSFKPEATLTVRFNRAPLTPTGLTVGQFRLSLPCAGEPALRTTALSLEASIVDPDNDVSGKDPSGLPVTATFRVARADAPDELLWEERTVPSPFWPNDHYVDIPPEILTQGRYVWSVFGTDGGSLVGPSASCAFTIDYERPEPPSITPLVGGQAVYVKGSGSGRGGVGIPGAFLISNASNDVSAYRYGVNTQVATHEISATENTVLNFTPTRSGRNYLSVEAIDAAGNRSLAAIFEFYVASGAPVPTPPAITVAGPTSFALGDVLTASVTLSDDAVTPYGSVTVTSGTTVVGNATFDERTKKLELDGPALGAGTKNLTFTYRSFPGAPAWSTQRALTIKPLAFLVAQRPSISGTVQVGKTLTANPSTWTPTPTTVKYQWRLDGKAVSGATSRTWKLPASAKGKRVTVAVTGSRTGYATRTTVSPATATVKAGVFVAPTPTITGTTKVGSTLKAVRGTWTPQPSTVKYQWKVGGVAVSGATNYWFKVPSSAKGKRVVVTVTGSRAGYVTKTVTSAATSLIR